MPATDRAGFAEVFRTRPVLLDAAMGTRLIAQGLDPRTDDPSLWVLDRPEAVARLHRLDLAAGADAVVTATFGANRSWLDRFGRSRDASRLNRLAVDLARREAGCHRFVLGSIGPTAIADPTSFLGQVDALLETPGGADALLLETFRFDQAESALRLLGTRSVPIVVSLFEWPEPPKDAADRLIDLGASAIGANCQVGIAPAVAIANHLRDVTSAPKLIKPSAGLPGTSMTSPEAFAAAVPELLALGVRLLGGCCGTTEAHIAAIRSAIDTSRDIHPRA